MRFHGTRRARALTFLILVLLLAAIWRVGTLYAQSVRRQLAPTLIARLQQQLGREVKVEALDLDRPGVLSARGVRVARSKTFQDGDGLRIQQLEIRYNPALLSWGSLLTRGVGQDTRAHLSAQGITAWQPAPFPADELLTADGVSLDFDLGPALHGNSADVAGTVQRVDVAHPRTRLARGPDGRWSFEALLPKKHKPSAGRFRGRVVLANAEIALTDFATAALPEPQQNTTRGDVTLDFASYPAVRFTAAGAVGGSHAGTFHVTGHRDVQQEQTFATVRASTGDLAYWYRYFVRKNSALALSAGAADADVVVWNQPKSPLQYRVQLAARQAAGQVYGINKPVQGFDGTLSVDPTLLTFRGTGVTAGVPLQADGRVGMGGSDRMEYHLTSARLTLASLHQLFPGFTIPANLSIGSAFPATVDLTRDGNAWQLNGTAALAGVRYQEVEAPRAVARFQGRFGPGRVPEVQGSIDGPLLTYQKQEAHDLHARFQWRDGLTQLQAQGALLGGAVEGRGWLDTGAEEPRFYLVGTARDVNASQVEHGQASLKLEGKVAAEFVASGTTSAPRISAYVRGTALHINGEPLDAVEARVRYADNRLEIPYASVLDHRVQASVTGSVDKDGTLRLQASAAGLDLQRVLQGRVKEPLSGTAYAAGEIRGSTKEPQFSGSIQLYHPRFREYAADYFETQVRASSPRDVQLSDVKLVRGLATASTPNVHLTRAEGEKTPWQVRSEIQVEGLSVVSALLLAGMPKADLEKNPLAAHVDSLSLSVDGPLVTPNVGFQLRLSRAVAMQMDLGQVQASGTWDWSERRVALAEASLTAPNLNLRASGEIRMAPETTAANFRERTSVDLAVHAGGIHLAPFLRRFSPRLGEYATLDATLASADAQIMGPLQAPSAAGGVRLTGVVLNGKAIELEPLRFQGSREAVVVRDFRARLDGGVVEAPALALLFPDKEKVRSLPDRVAGSLNVRGVPIASLRTLVEASPYYQRDAARAVREALEEWNDPVNGTLTAYVSVPLTGGLPVPDALPELVKALRERVGPAVAQGSLAVPNLQSPPAADRPGIHLAGAFTYSARRLEVRDLRLQQPSGVELTASGYVDSPMSEKRSMRLDLTGKGVKLASLARLPVNRIREALQRFQPLDGTADLTGTVSGDPKVPHAQFALTLHQPVIAGVSFDEFSLQDAVYTGEAGQNAHLTFKSAVLSKQVEGQPNATVTASGSWPLSWPELSSPRDAVRNLHFEAPRQSLVVFTELAREAETLAQTQPELPTARAAALFRALAATQGLLHAEVTLGGTADTPSNSGQITLVDATLQPPGLETEVRNFNVNLTLEGNRLRVQRFHGDSSRGGSFDGRGEVVFGRGNSGNAAARLDLTLDVDAFKFNERRLGRVVGESFKGTQVQGTLSSVSPGNPGRRVPLILSGQWPAPTLSGGILLDDSRMLLAMNGVSGSHGTPLPGDVQLNVRLLAGKNVWLRNPGVQMQFTGALLASNTLSQPVVTGDLHASHGTLNLPTMRLRSVGGLVRVSYDQRNTELGVEAASPVYVDLTGSSTIRVQRTPTSEAESYDLTVEMRGSPSGGETTGIRAAGLAGGLAVGAEGGLTLTVRTDPPLPNYQIEALIRQQFGGEGFAGGGSNVVEALKSQVEEAFAVNLASAITSPIEQRLESALGLSIFSIDIGVTQPLRVQVGRRLFGPIFGTITQEFGPADGTQQRRFEAYYRITPQLRIGYRREEPIRRQVFFISGGFSF